MRGRETITIKRRAYDHNGDPTGPETDIEVRNCLVWPRTSTEDDERGIVPISGMGAWLPSGTDLRADDVVVARGERWQVEGVPADHHKFSGRAWGILVALERVGVGSNA